MAAYMSRKCLLHFCRQILLPRHVQPTDCQKFGSHLQAYRSLFSTHGLIQHATFQKTSSVSLQPTGPSLIQACHKRLGLSYSTSSQSAEETLKPQATSNADVDEPDDKLYKWIELRVKGHDDAVLESYTKFVDLAADELDITVDSIAKPTRHIKKLTLLKSRHVYKKHRAQYEFRTYYRVIKLARLTGSTASVFLEYIERNLPEGLAMQVKKCSIQRLPEHLTTRPEDLADNQELTSSSSSSDSDSGSDMEGDKTRDSR